MILAVERCAHQLCLRCLYLQRALYNYIARVNVLQNVTLLRFADGTEAPSNENFSGRRIFFVFRFPPARGCEINSVPAGKLLVRFSCLIRRWKFNLVSLSRKFRRHSKQHPPIWSRYANGGFEKAKEVSRRKLFAGRPTPVKSLKSSQRGNIKQYCAR